MAFALVDPQPGYLGHGCTDACHRQKVRPYAVLHDPAAHEAYGYRQAVEATRSPLVRTGILEVRFSDRTISIGGGPRIAPTPTEWRLLSMLATRLNQIVSREELAIHIYGVDWVSATPKAIGHCLNVYAARLRRRLGPAASLVQTRVGQGLMLAEVPVGVVLPPLPFGARYTGRWALKYDRCQDCGTSEHPHAAHGRCTRCEKIRRKNEVPV